MKLVNLTPHAITLTHLGNETVIPPSGQVARVAAKPGPVTTTFVGVPVHAPDSYGAVECLPEPVDGTHLIVSAMVGARVSRPDVLVPGTGPGDNPVREGGRIVAVTRLKATGMVDVLEDDLECSCRDCHSYKAQVVVDGRALCWGCAEAREED